MFRTSTGQTGTDAYIYEAAQIINARRELDARAARLANAMAEELASEAAVTISIRSNRFPNATMQADSRSIVRMLSLNGQAVDAEYLYEMARGLADPSYVISH